METVAIFQNFFKPFYDELEKSLESNVLIKKKTDFLSVSNNLYQELFSLSYLTLIYELNNFRDNGFLEGETSEDRYDYFEKIIGEVFFREYMEKKYPALINLMNEKLNHVIECVKLILDAFYKDQELLEETFGKTFRHIKDIKIGTGDSHESGQTVAILTGDFGSIVYKPNNLMNDIILNELIDQINPALTLKFKKIKVLSRNNYGWQEYIRHTSCNNKQQICSYYHRLGSYLALFYILNASDYHNENVIAAGEYPMIIDTETLITTGKNSSVEDKNLYNLLQDNVLRSGLLPVQTQDSYLDIDMSGLSGGDMKSSKLEVFDIQNQRTDQMVVKKVLLEGEVDKNHMPFVQGEKTNVLDYIDNFSSGFKECMVALLNKKEDLSNWLDKDIFKRSTYRQVLRPTYVYGKILDAGNYPTYLIESRKRLGLLERVICKESSDRERDEVSVLFKGNIPAYECYYNSTDLYRNGKLIAKNYFSESPRSVVERKIESLSKKTIQFQMRLIECSILTILNDLSIPDEEIQVVENKYKSFEESFATIYEKILAYEITLPNKKIKDIVQVKANGNRYMLGGSNFSLYEGGGMIWSIYCYGLETKNIYIQHTAECLLEKAELNYNNSNSLYNCSAFSETFGAVYLYYNFYKQSGHEEYYFRYKKYLNKCIEKIENCSEWDYVTGVSGVIHLLSNLYRDQPNELLNKLIFLSADKLSDLLVKEKVRCSGIAHGLSGAAIAFADLFDVTGKIIYMDKAFQLLIEEAELEMLDTKAWCNGLGGILLAHAEALSSSTDRSKDYVTSFKRFKGLLQKFLSLPNRNNVCVCHGNSGELDLLHELLLNYSELLTKKEIETVRNRIVGMSKLIPETNGVSLGVPYGLPLDTFMMGSSGVAYTQLRVKSGSVVYPSLMMLNISKNKEVKDNGIEISVKQKEIKGSTRTSQIQKRANF